MLALYCADRSALDWLEDMRDHLSRYPIAYFWWHQLPDGGEETLKKLKSQLDSVGFIPIYIKASEKYFLLISVDFVIDPLNGIPDEWIEKYELNYPFQLALKRHINNNREFLEKFFQDRGPRILFAVSSIQEIPAPKVLDWDKIYVRCKVQNI